MKNVPILLSRISTFLLLIILLTNCKKDIKPEPVVIDEATVVNKFIYNRLKQYYLWSDQVPNLYANFAKKDSLNAFLNRYADPNLLFTDLLYKYKTIDKWSFIVDDSKVIDDWVQGISETMGFDFMLYRVGTAGDVFGVVRYIYKGSPAEKAGIKRGDLFMKVDGTQLTVDNYQTLLFTNATYTLSMASISGNYISLNGNSVTMTAVTMQENPILLDTVLNIETHKIGYLVYNGFNSLFDIQLNDVFKKFKDAGITSLILDLRYNGGGSVQSAKYLASMIYGTATSEVFIKSRYNSDFQNYIVQTYGASSLIENFTNVIANTETSPLAHINTLNLKKLYVITSDNTASASELLINGLKPYMTVFSVGINTAGKYVGSLTIKDWDDNGVVNPNNNWAMQPIVVKISNANDISDFVDGLTPNYLAEEDIASLLPFGDQNETLLRVALNDIQGIAQSGKKSLKSEELGLKKVFDSQDIKPFAKQMYINKLGKN
jgi:carboxyl-terminal processing protease